MKYVISTATPSTYMEGELTSNIFCKILHPIWNKKQVQFNIQMPRKCSGIDPHIYKSSVMKSECYFLWASLFRVLFDQFMVSNCRAGSTMVLQAGTAQQTTWT
jgi:hypothetical protein